MTPADLENFILAEAAIAWQALIEMDRESGGTGELHDTAISLTKNRTQITVHANYSDDDQMLSAWFRLPESLPDRWFLLDLHEWLEGKVAEPPKLCVPDPRVILH